jgi:hypothetical protein
MSILVPLRAFTPGGQPSRTHYQVLDISSDVRDPKAIEEAALRCSSQVRAYQLICESECALRLNEIAQALIALLENLCRWKTDQVCGTVPGPGESECQRSARQGPHAESCDVRLVHRRLARRWVGRGTSCDGETRPEN